MSLAQPFVNLRYYITIYESLKTMLLREVVIQGNVSLIA